MNNKDSGNNKKAKKAIITVFVVIVALIAVMLVLSEVVLPGIYDASSKSDNRGDDYEYSGSGTRRFYLDEEITPELLRGYDDCLKYIYYEKDGEKTLVTDGSFYEVGGYPAVFFSEYIDAIKRGDSEKYTEFFSDSYDSENGLDKHASGEYGFSPQRLYDVSIKVLSEKFNEETGLTDGEYELTYRIFLNTGDFRNDITDDTAPLVIRTVSYGEAMEIVDVDYRYK